MYTFIESSNFERVCPIYLDDDEYADLQQHLLLNPEAGDIVPGSGGVRKLRWARKGMGKRRGLRVIYYVRIEPPPVLDDHVFEVQGQERAGSYPEATVRGFSR